MVRNVDTPAAFTVVEQPNAIGLVAWLFKRELIAKVSDDEVGPGMPDGGLRRGIDGRDRRPGPGCGTACSRSMPLDCRPRNSRGKLLNPFSGLQASRRVAALVCVVDHRDPNPAAACCSVIWSM